MVIVLFEIAFMFLSVATGLLSVVAFTNSDIGIAIIFATICGFCGWNVIESLIFFTRKAVADYVNDLRSIRHRKLLVEVVMAVGSKNYEPTVDDIPQPGVVEKFLVSVFDV